MNRKSITEESANSGLVPQLGMMVRALWDAPVRNALFLLSGALFLVVAATAYGQIRLNSWNQPFYDALSRRDFAQFLKQLVIFGLIAAVLLILNVAQRWLGETLKLRLREGLAHDLIRNWLQPGRAFRLANAGAIGVNPDQRMHEDARHLTELSADLGIGLLQSSILLATFVAVLSLSNDFVFHFGDRNSPSPDTWFAAIHSGSASLLSYWSGAIWSTQAERYARGRYALLVGAHKRAHRRHRHERARPMKNGASKSIWRRCWLPPPAGCRPHQPSLSRRAMVGLRWWLRYWSPRRRTLRKDSFGGLMLASGAFMQVQSSLRWFVDNFSTIADWRRRCCEWSDFGAPSSIPTCCTTPRTALPSSPAIRARSVSTIWRSPRPPAQPCSRRRKSKSTPATGF
jgi:putative ATP-binding cassette transporter